MKLLYLIQNKKETAEYSTDQPAARTTRYDPFFGIWFHGGRVGNFHSHKMTSQAKPRKQYGRAEVMPRTSPSPLAGVYETEEFREEWRRSEETEHERLCGEIADATMVSNWNRKRK